MQPWKEIPLFSKAIKFLPFIRKQKQEYSLSHMKNNEKEINKELREFFFLSHILKNLIGLPHPISPRFFSSPYIAQLKPIKRIS